MAIELPPGIRLDFVLDDWVPDPEDGRVMLVPSHLLRDTPDLSQYVASLPDASGEFTGFYDEAVAAQVLGPLPDLISVEVDTHGRPNLLATAPAGAVLTFEIAGMKFRMTIHKVEPLGGSRVRALVWRESVTEIPPEEDSDG
jgi:hypothetical protein